MSNIYRSIDTHHIDEGSRQLSIYAVEPLDKNQAPSTYWLHGGECHTCISFQNGTIPEVGVNGVTAEALLVIIADRLRCFQEGKFRCVENESALICVEKALQHLNERTMNRIKRGVEGQHKP